MDYLYYAGNYLFYLGLIFVLGFIFILPTTIISVIVGLLEYLIKREGMLFYVGRMLRVYIITSVFLTFALFYIELGFSTLWILCISYFGLMFWWMLETRNGIENYYKNIEFKLAVDKKAIVWLIYTVVFFSTYSFGIPLEPFLSTLILGWTIALLDYKIFSFFVVLSGIGILIAYGMKIYNSIQSRRHHVQF